MQIVPARVIGHRQRLRLTQKEYAREIGVSLRTVLNWESGDTKEPRVHLVRKLETAFGRAQADYLLGEDAESVGKAIVVQSQEPPPPYKTNVKAIMPAVELYHRKVPVVSWAKAGLGGNYYDLADQIDEWLDTDCRDENAYALILEGDSMEPEFRSGDRVIFLPNTPAQNGDVVVARLLDGGQVFFKLYHETGKQNQTVRLNSYKDPPYVPMEYPKAAFRFIHPMHSMTRKRRRC